MLAIPCLDCYAAWDSYADRTASLTGCGRSSSGAGEPPGMRKALADRIQARAVRSMGELLKQFDGKDNNQHKEGILLTQK
jgi:hypothetical protein